MRLGDVDGRIPVFMDRNAFEEADVIVPINRVKPHTDFTGDVESGLMKMIAIGTGKQLGADAAPQRGLRDLRPTHPGGQPITPRPEPTSPSGWRSSRMATPRMQRIEAVPADRMFEREQGAPRQGHRLLARLPIDGLDVSILDRIGKDISGTGMDSIVVGRYYRGPTDRGPSISGSSSAT